MNRFSESSGMGMNTAVYPRKLRELARQLKIHGRCTMHMGAESVRRMRRAMRAVVTMECADFEPVRRMKMDMGQIEACLCAAAEDRINMLPQTRGEARVLWLARFMVGNGENSMDLQQLIKNVCTFDSACSMEMREIQAVPAAMKTAVCQALTMLMREAVILGSARHRAEAWVRRGGRSGLKHASDDFLERALKLCTELELPDIHAQLVRFISRQGDHADRLVERVHHREAALCLRLDNLLKFWHMLESLNWEKCFRRISGVDQELNRDPAGVYDQMDMESRFLLREMLAELAQAAKTEELNIARYALAEACASVQERGPHDPRSCVCWYIADDSGRRQLFRNMGVESLPPRRIPDSDGNKTVVVVSAAAALIFGLLLWMMKRPLLAVFSLPLAWAAAMQLIGGIYPRLAKPMRLLRLELESIPDHARTLVVLPVLLSSEQRVQEMLAHMEDLGCLEADENIDFLLLGDFRDEDQSEAPDDKHILSAAKQGIAELNERAERKKYYYLHRMRTYRQKDGRWMGENRKRGALMALNGLLLERPEAIQAFQAENTAAKALAGRYRYVVTLDADTEYLPGTIQKLAGTMLHPLNRHCCIDGRRRGYAVLQPAMQLMAEACTNEYVKLMAGTGGMDNYPVSISNFYQDINGRGCFAGKGIYDVNAFARATEGQLRDDEILSHDLIEGILAGAGYLNDICFFDSCPEKLDSDFLRMHRWIRGDWQLLPVLFSRMKLAAVDRLKLLDNLVRSMYAPALTALLIHSVWLDSPEAFFVALVLAFQVPILRLPRAKWREWKAAMMRFSLLPAEAACALDAILRTLWRMAFTHKHLMDWVPAADAGKNTGNIRLPGRMAALLLLPGLLRPFWIPAVLASAALFWVGADWAYDLVHTPLNIQYEFSERQRSVLNDIAARTWLFFKTFVSEDSCGLPPDNVQLDPPAGAAQRTSPTNIGLYLTSCICAAEMKFISKAEMLARMHKTVDTLEKLDKWNGQLYNWYDLKNLEPLRPRYVSAVDSGNLAGSLLLCAEAVRKADTMLSERLYCLANRMNLAKLYDKDRELFFIGIDAESGRMSQAHYDLYASESRILSYTAIMLGQVPVRHWKHLSRAAVYAGRNQTLYSWSGTMFEYLMPELFMHSTENTLAGQMRRGAVESQIAWGKLLNRPWGVSESGYYAFDMHLNYQYRAFGLRSLALNGNAAQDVVAPYASALALSAAPAAAADNLIRMCEMGWSGEFGLYEAADYMHAENGQKPRMVRSHMAHHQGMAMGALCNGLCNDYLSRTFMRIPQARALRLLLQEKPYERVRARRRSETVIRVQTFDHPERDYARNGRSDGCIADSHLIRGGETTALVLAHGAVFAWSRDIQLNRYDGELRNRNQGMYVHVRNARTGEDTVIGRGAKVRFGAGSACFYQKMGELKLKMHICVSPETGAVYQLVEAENTGAESCCVEITGCLAAALASEKDMRAHPVFQNMFVESTNPDENTVCLHRRSREPEADSPEMVYTVSGPGKAEFETSLEKLTGRTGFLNLPGGISHTFSGTTGNTLNPCAALRMRLDIGSGQTEHLFFALALLPRDNPSGYIDSIRDSAAPERALQLVCTQTQAVLNHAGIDARHFRLFQRASVLLFDARLRNAVMENNDACPPVRRDFLWHAGISGDLPILMAEFDGAGQMDCVRDAVRMHAFYRLMGVKLDLVLVNMHGSDYLQPARSSIGDLLASSHLNGQFGVPGGAYVLERPNLDDAVYEAISRAAAMRFTGDADTITQLRGMIGGLILQESARLIPMQPGQVQFPNTLRYFNGYGGFDAADYVIQLRNGMLPPAPWCNVIASESAGAIVSERGGGYAWFGNSRFNRLTPFANDSLHEGWGWMFYLLDERDGSWARLLPGNKPMADFCVRHAPGSSRWSACAGNIAFDVEIRGENNGLHFDIALKNESRSLRHLRLAGLVNWLMGTDAADAALLRTWSRYGACFASGTAQSIGCFAADDPQARSGCSLKDFCSGGDMMNPGGLDTLEYPQGGWSLHVPVILHPGEIRHCRFLLGCADTQEKAYALAAEFRSGGALRRSREDWPARLEKLKIETPDDALNRLANGFLQTQILNARIRGRTGLYQPGGAYGFRDQLQDMLPMIHYEPERVRRHLLYCAARQFEAGDVLHWWHEPFSGVRTRISDDMLFLPYVAAQYVRITGDDSVLRETIPFLKDISIPDGKEDIYAQMQPTAHTASLHIHCMRAFRRAASAGQHGLCRMGTGDWNDGMNRVGRLGRGESIWLSEFLAVCAADYARIAPEADDRTWLEALNRRMCAAVEAHGWDGKWYLRAYTDDGRILGGEACPECRIDLISQAWAVLAGLDHERCSRAMQAAWENLADEKLNIIRLLAPPFAGNGIDPGYIAAYPPGVRENGAQYTHAACWMLYALSEMGDGARAHRALQMLLPVNHARNMEEADLYRVEPYVMAADIYAENAHAGRGGWTWYTGSAAWMLQAVLKLLGFERMGNQVRMCALLHTWPEAVITLQFGLSRYRLICRRDAEQIRLDDQVVEGEFIHMQDDGREHTAVFPPRV